MGYYYDWIEEQWVERPRDRVVTWGQRQRQQRRRKLLTYLIAEMTESRDGVATLYAALLARTLVASDEELMGAFGEQIARIGARPQRGAAA